MKNQVFPPKNSRKSARSGQSGNILILIFIAVALFGALSFAMMRGGRTNVGTFTDEQAKLAATEIIGYANMMKDSYKMLLINGCTEANISFANSLYTNASHYPDPGTAPADKSCHIFDTAGGKVMYKDFSKVRLNNPPYTGFSYASIMVEGVGSPTADTAIVMNFIPDPLCRALNKQLNNMDEIFPGSGGAMIETGDNQTSANCPKCVGKFAACIFSSTTNNFYYILKSN